MLLQVASLQEGMQTFCNVHQIGNKAQGDLGKIFGTSISNILSPVKVLSTVCGAQMAVSFMIFHVLRGYILFCTQRKVVTGGKANISHIISHKNFIIKQNPIGTAELKIIQSITKKVIGRRHNKNNQHQNSNPLLKPVCMVMYLGSFFYL